MTSLALKIVTACRKRRHITQTLFYVSTGSAKCALSWNTSHFTINTTLQYRSYRRKCATCSMNIITRITASGLGRSLLSLVPRPSSFPKCVPNEAGRSGDEARVYLQNQWLASHCSIFTGALLLMPSLLREQQSKVPQYLKVFLSEILNMLVVTKKGQNLHLCLVFNPHVDADIIP